MNEAWMAALAVGVISLVGHIVFDWLKGKRKNGSSGERPVEFWQQVFRETMTEVIEDKFDAMIDNQNRVLSEILALQRGINDGIVRLVALQEMRSRYEPRQ